MRPPTSAMHERVMQESPYTAPLVLEPESSARAAGLRYCLDDRPGIARRASGKSFRYYAPSGALVRDQGTLARIRSLAIPPAWTGVWICPREDGHLQATGRDARGRKQYRYHERWRQVRDETKYGKMAAFAAALPRIRRRVSRDLALRGLPREKVLATVVRLLETTFMRVGNEEYARENDSYGLTTLRTRQVQVRGQRLRFRFRGKAGVQHCIELREPRLVAIVRRMQDLPGQELFQYVDDAGATHAIESADVNDYLREVAGEEFTSKDFRTWAGSVLALEALAQAQAPESASHARRVTAAAIEQVARRLGNTRAVCRKCYIHPRVLDAYAEGSLARFATARRGSEAALRACLAARQRKLPRRSASLGKSNSRSRSARRLLRTTRQPLVQLQSGASP
ncbi:MAG: DNA topoisomerase IB [Clostridia bacterium]